MNTDIQRLLMSQMHRAYIDSESLKYSILGIFRYQILTRFLNTRDYIEIVLSTPNLESCHSEVINEMSK